MGLDQYAYVAVERGQREKFFSGAKWNVEADDFVNPHMKEPLEISYWRKHPNLQGWMEKLWIEKGSPGQKIYDNYTGSVFNGVELELTWDDIIRLEQDINSGEVATLNTTGFFFGSVSDDYYREHDLEFVRNAKHYLFLGFRVFYNSSW